MCCLMGQHWLTNYISYSKYRGFSRASLSIDNNKALLVYLPFEDRPHELVHGPLNMAINKQQLSLSSNL